MNISFIRVLFRQNKNHLKSLTSWYGRMDEAWFLCLSIQFINTVINVKAISFIAGKLENKIKKLLVARERNFTFKRMHRQTAERKS